jgi:hypothetical protein
VENTKGQRKVPEWLRSAAMDSEGRIYIPAVVGGNEAVVSLPEHPKQKGDLEHMSVWWTNTPSDEPKDKAPRRGPKEPKRWLILTDSDRSRTPSPNA